MAPVAYRKIPSLKTASDFKTYLNHLGISLPFDDKIQSGPDAPLNQPLQLEDKTIGNRFCVLPMEGWDALSDGSPSELTERRWQRFALSGAKLIWGAEACAVCHQGKGNPRQLMINERTVTGIARLRQALTENHQKHFGKSDDLLVGLQLSHSGRFARPNDINRLEPKIVYNNPVLDSKISLEKDYSLLNDQQIQQIIQHFINAATLAEKAGFDFVDIKLCHGYLGHEFLSAHTRPGPFGGSFQNRTRFLTEIVSGIRANTQSLKIGVRLSIFDFLPFRKNQKGIGEAQYISGDYPFAFGADQTGLRIDLVETIKLLDLLADMDIKLVCATAGSPYYNPHITRPAMSPPCDGYLPPEDPLVGVARLINATAELKKKRPNMLFIGSAYTYLQQWLPHVAQAVITSNMADSIGLGRMMLAYPDIVADILDARSLDKKRLCLTNSNCTTAPRNGMVSGCYTHDPLYRSRPDFKILKQIKKNLRNI
jgi:2,4-dienoyl-CoA reductase-like NADH-dependent reductase (Old Yellow Enzyme family)